MLAPAFVCFTGCCFKPEQGMCQPVMSVLTGRKRLSGEKTYRKGVNNNWLIYFTLIDMLASNGSLRKKLTGGKQMPYEARIECKEGCNNR